VVYIQYFLAVFPFDANGRDTAVLKYLLRPRLPIPGLWAILDCPDPLVCRLLGKDEPVSEGGAATSCKSRSPKGMPSKGARLGEKVVIRPLRKTKLDGLTYYRRDVVEAEIHEIANLDEAELERRAALWPSRVPGFVLPEVLVYLVRTLPAGVHRDNLTGQLLMRVGRRLPPTTNAGGQTESLTKMNIRDDVFHRFVDLLLSDRAEYDDRLDYYEVNFFKAIAAALIDASTRHWTHENRSEALGTDEQEVSEHVEAAVGDYDPFDADELDKKNYRLMLDEAIDSLPELHRRIVEMLRQEIPIESKDPSVDSISKVLGKTEKTIRTHRDKAFASLRKYLERKGKF